MSLTKAGYNVTLCVVDGKGNEKRNEISIVDARTKTGGRLSRMTKTVWHLYKKAIAINAKLYHFHDPELIPLGILLKLSGKKVVYDVHEDYPKQTLSKDYLGNIKFRKLIAWLIFIVEKVGERLFDGVIGATPDITKNFYSKKSITIRNLPVMKLIDEAKSIRDIKKVKPVIIYAGGLSRIRGIRDIIKAMEYVEDKAQLWLLGRWESENFRKECEDLRGWGYTRYAGLARRDEVYKYLKIADIGLSVLHPRVNYLTSLPIKTFEYMCCSIPIIMSDFPFWREVFSDCAVFVRAEDPKDIAEKIMLLIENEQLRSQLGSIGRNLIEQEYSWEAEEKKLIGFYDRILL